MPKLQNPATASEIATAARTTAGTNSIQMRRRKSRISPEHFCWYQSAKAVTITDSARTPECVGLLRDSEKFASNGANIAPTTPKTTARTTFKVRRLGRGVRRLSLLEDDGGADTKGSIRPAGATNAIRGDDTERLGREQSDQNKACCQIR